MKCNIVTEYINKYNIKYLHYLTHINNIPSIFCHGILSRNVMKKLSLIYTDISNPSVQNNREFKKPGILNSKKNIHDYVPLYFSTQTPMQYVVSNSARSRTTQNIVAQNKLVFIDVDPASIFTLSNMIFTDGNASNRETKFYNDLKDFDKIDWNVINSPGDYHGSNGQCYKKEWQRKKCSEVLVAGAVPQMYFSRIVVCGESGAQHLFETINNAQDRMEKDFYNRIKQCVKYSSQLVSELLN